jgi:hypothetical protein
MIDGASVNVLDFGADPTGLVDSTSEIQSAVTAAENGAVYFPAGTYLINTAINLPSNILVYGDGDSSIIKSTSLSNAAPYPGLNQFVVNTKTNFKIQNLKFDNSLLTVFTGGVRCFYIIDCSYYVIENCTFVTCGAATASLKSNNYLIEGNTAVVSATDSVAHHDGIFDNWWGCSNFKIIANTVIGNGIARYPYLVTGVATDNVTPASCSYFDISHNIAQDCIQVGIWSQGNLGTNLHFNISNNKIKNVSNFHGIRISDSGYFTIDSNIIDTVESNGIRFDKEAVGTYSAQYGTVTGNIISNANQGSFSAGDGAAINLTNDTENVHIEATVITGSSHTYPILLGASTLNNYVGDGQYAPGTDSPQPFNGGANTNVLLYGSYTPVLSNVLNVTSSTEFSSQWTRRSNYITVTGQISVTPTSNTLTKVGISLPVNSNFTSAQVDCSGVGATQTAGGIILADTTNDRAEFQWTTPSSGVANVIAYTFTYRVQ